MKKQAEHSYEKASIASVNISRVLLNISRAQPFFFVENSIFHEMKV